MIQIITLRICPQFLPCLPQQHRSSNSFLKAREWRCGRGGPLPVGRLYKAHSESLQASVVPDDGLLFERDEKVLTRTGIGVEESSRELLGWQDVCKQVASFCSTPMAVQTILAEGLPIGDSQNKSEDMLQETHEGMLGDFSFEGVFNVPLILQPGQQQQFSGVQLNGIASTLEAGLKLQCRLQEVESPMLDVLAKDLVLINASIPKAIRRCIRDPDGYVMDSAAEELAEIRRKLEGASKELKSELDAVSQNFFKNGLSERPMTVFRRGRVCIPVKAAFRGQVPKGSLALGMSGSRQTVYIEPASVIQLNNRITLLKSSEEDAESKVLDNLSEKVNHCAKDILLAIKAMEKLDLVCARGRHAHWISGVRPSFTHPRKKIREECSMILAGARHPLLMELALPALPDPPSIFDVPATDIGKIMLPEEEPDQLTCEESTKLRELPKPVNISVPARKTVVALTGPNTGGKTATLKTLGILTLMAKAGMYLPIESTENRRGYLPWFDKVLADIGDSQSLEQNLSTFSGHVKRIIGILNSGTPESLVLLDELGSGTDPTEGSSLGCAVLERLSSCCRLTVATTHHAEIKVLAEEDPLFVNASMEFDPVSLKPTYRLLWGRSGESNALDIALTLGFDPLVVKEARNIFEQERGKTSDAESSHVAISMLSNVERVKESIVAAEKNLEEDKEELESIQAEINNLEMEEKELREALLGVSKVQTEIKSDLDWILEEAANGNLAADDVEDCLREIEARLPNQLEDSFEGEDVWQPSLGDSVQVAKLGNKIGTVVSFKSGGRVNVEVGQINLDLEAWEYTYVDEQPKKAVRKPDHLAKLAYSSDNVEEATERDAPVLQGSNNTVDIRGKTIDDGLIEVDTKMWQTSAGGYFHIIHGRGTGKLRAGVLEFLGRDSRVAEFYDDDVYEGGCTVVKIK